MAKRNPQKEVVAMAEQEVHVPEWVSEASRPEGSSVLSDFDLEASELLVDSSDVGVVERLVEAYNFKECGRVFSGEKELVVLRK